MSEPAAGVDEERRGIAREHGVRFECEEGTEGVCWLRVEWGKKRRGYDDIGGCIRSLRCRGGR